MATHIISRRQFLHSLAFGVAAAALAACAPRGEKTGGGQATEAPTAAAVPEATAAPLKLGGEIRVSHWWGDSFSKQTKVTDMFTEKTGIKVKEEPDVYPGEKTLTELAAGTAADVLLVDAPNNGIFMRKNIFLPIEDALAKYNLDPNLWAVDPAKENGYQGHVMGVSLFPMQTVILFVNKKLAEETGVKLPTWGDSTQACSPEFDTWHWTNLLDFVRKGTKRKADGTVEQYGIDGNWGGVHLYAWIRDRIFDLGGREFDDGVWNYDEKECLINSPEAVRAVQEVLNLIMTEKVAPTAEAAAGVEGGLFRAGKAMSVVCFSGAHIFPPKDINFEQAYISYPWDKKRVYEVGANWWAINKTTKNRDAAEAWAILTTTDFDLGQEQMLFNLPAYNTRAHIEKAEPGPYRECYEIWVSRTAMSNCKQCTENVELVPRWMGGKVAQAFQERISAAIDKVLLGEMSVQQALDEVKTKVDEEIKKT